MPLKVRPDILAGIERIAAEQERSRSKIGEMLLAWSLRQLQIAGSFDTLMTSTIAARRRSAKEGMAQLRKDQENIEARKFPDQHKKIS